MSDNDFKDSLKIKENLNNQAMSLLNSYQESNSFNNREFLCYLTSAIYLTSKKLFPQLTIYIPFRTKSDLSFIKNIQKEFPKLIMDSDDLTKPLDTFPIEKDISGIRIVLDDVNESKPANGESEQILNDPNIQKLSPYYKRTPNDVSTAEFIKKAEKYLSSPTKTGKEHFSLKKELLQRIINLTPKEFTKERNPLPSFSQLYDETQVLYDYYLENDLFPSPEHDLVNFKDLLNELRSKSSDQYQFAILNKILPIVFDDPLIKNALRTTFKFEKETKKPNGFQSIYYSFQTPFGPIEVQAQSNRAYYSATKGSSYHSGMNGKTVNIKNFFELVDPNDEHPISYYLDKLDNISADKLISEYEIPSFETEEEMQQFLSTPNGIKYAQSNEYREMMKHIRIKKNITISSPPIPDELYDSTGNVNEEKLQELIDSGKKFTFCTVDSDEYLISTALSLSPYMNVCSSGHTSTTTVSIHHKKVIGEFSEILRKKDYNTCLREILIRRLEAIINDNIEDKSSKSESAINSINNSVAKAKQHENDSLHLPKDISKKNILSYAEKLKRITTDKSKATSTSQENSKDDFSL